MQGVTLREAARCLGQRLAVADQALHAAGVSVVSIRRASGGVIGTED